MVRQLPSIEALAAFALHYSCPRFLTCMQSSDQRESIVHRIVLNGTEADNEGRDSVLTTIIP